MKCLIFLFLLKLPYIKSEKYEKINLKCISSLYYLALNISKITEESYFLLSNNIPISFYPTTNCKICTQLKLNETKLNLIAIKENINIPYYHNEYSGNIYIHNISLSNSPNIASETQFIGFNKVSYKSTFSINGIFSLSFLNYKFNISENIFAFQFIKDNCILHLGGYNYNLIKNNNNLKSYDVIINNKNDVNYKQNWFINFNEIYVNNEQYIFEKNEKINNNIKLTFDIGTDKLHLPKKFFFDNMEKLFPKNSHCQIHPDGYFICNCGDDYKTAFGNISFNINNYSKFMIYPVDYIVYETGITGSTCLAKIKINYENDIFVAGNVVLKNYYSIFNVENNTLLLYRNEEKSIDIIFFILIILIIAFAALLILIIYFCRKKCRNNYNRNFIINNNNEQNVVNEEFEDDDIQEPINPGQGESSEETE